MDSGSGDGPDASSIRPVSSLRARFEKISNGKPSVPSPRSTTPAHVLVAEQERGRSSLDIPRGPSQWDLTGESQFVARPSATNDIRQPIPRRLAPGAVDRQRPLSMGPWSPPRSPPTLTLQSPVSPPKPLDMSDAHRRLQRQVTQEPIRRELPVSISATMTGSPRILAAPPKLPLPSAESSRGHSPAGLKKPPPPPINRASKPGTPTSFAFNLDPSKNQSRERISPFSTPPSSDESPGRVFLPQDGSTGNARPGQSGYFPPPPIHHAVEARREAVAERAERKSSLASIMSLPASSSKASDASDHPDQRPILPNRPRPQVSPPRTAHPRIGSNIVSSRSRPPPRPPEASKVGRSGTDFLPPPKRNFSLSGPTTPQLPERLETARPLLSRSITSTNELVFRPQAPDGIIYETANPAFDVPASEPSATDYPDASQTNRRPPKSKCGVHRVWTQYDTRLFDLCGSRVCTGGYIARAWDTSNSRMIMDLALEEREIKVTALVFKPGKNADEEGLQVWLGNNYGEIQEVDLKSQAILETKSNAHLRREIIKMYRYQNSIWSLDDDGKLHVWGPGSNGMPSLKVVPVIFRVARGHSFSINVKDYLWIASGKEIRVYDPLAGEQGFNVTIQSLYQPNTGDITSGAVLSNQFDKIFFGHTDGKISMYSTKDLTCLGVVNASSYKINCLGGAGVYLWAGFNTGMIYVYDTQTKPWKVRKEWQAHQNPVSNILVDRSSVWKFGHLQVASLGADNAICFWDGMLEDDWIENDMQQHDIEYCAFKEIRTVVMTWNAGASTPSGLRHDENDNTFFREIIQPQSAPDILVFGFQELVDLEDKKLTAKSLFKSSKKKDPSDPEHMSHQYRAWRDYLGQLIEETMPATESYTLLHTSSMVGLFSCIFVKSPLRSRVRNLNVAEIKRGLGGLHGNKGAIMIRFILEDTSLCFTNCHLAAGQTQTVNRNNDIAAILEAGALPAETDSAARTSSFTGGGDGSMVMDHEICILNGDLNYRIDTMSKDTVVKAINAKNLPKLLERDQLLVSKRRNPAFRLRAFNEQTITFPPTYKYDVGTDRYDSSEKNRSPAWCDRLLYRGAGRVKQIEYRRHELRLSDHRPVSGTFLMRIKSIDPRKREVVWEQCEARLLEMRQRLGRDAKLDYLVNVMGVGEHEARGLLDK